MTMDLFESRTSKLRRSLFILLPLLLLVLICAIFFFSIEHTSQDTLKKEQHTLEQALQQGAIHTYAMTGAYPESLDALLENYNIHYDSTKFVVEYTPNGSNLLPYIGVLPIASGKDG